MADVPPPVESETVTGRSRRLSAPRPAPKPKAPKPPKAPKEVVSTVFRPTDDADSDQFCFKCERKYPPREVQRTLRRHLTLFEHRLDPAALARLHAAIDAIGAEALAA